MALILRRSAVPQAAAKRTIHAGRPAVRVPTRKVMTHVAAEPTTNPVNENVQKVQAAALEAWTWVKTKWEATEDSEKPAVVAILAGVTVAQIAIGATIDVVDRIPVFSTLLQLVGLGVTGYYIYRLTTDPAERDAVKSTIADFLDKVTGDGK
ncbi:hypothetical protein Vretimale_17576 [Volvox reticuliferus]|uniref:Uncharacterized protein n=1 Tax=Volvox reticuliferus TaxID=1737510 RepID=A0A8J4LYK8_9CHLO|nr:hypothetical protein Vretifemale_3448 [Volvox reticuliferus]GIM14763.1 hypothetical protein Vretimale_17576 [Volvox reticuliferus]